MIKRIDPVLARGWEYVALRGALQASLVVLVGCALVWLFSIG